VPTAARPKVHTGTPAADETIWDDTQIRPGAVWADEIEAAIAAARVAVLLVLAYLLVRGFILLFR